MWSLFSFKEVESVLIVGGLAFIAFSFLSDDQWLFSVQVVVGTFLQQRCLFLVLRGGFRGGHSGFLLLWGSIFAFCWELNRANLCRLLGY